MVATVSDTRESAFDDLGAISGVMDTTTANGTKDTPPRSTSGATRPKVTPRAPAPRTSQDKLEKKLLETVSSVALLLAAFNPRDATVLLENADSRAVNWAALAQENAKVKKALEALLETNAWSGAIIATAATILPILDNHGHIPERFSAILRSPAATAGDSGTAPNPMD